MQPTPPRQAGGSNPSDQQLSVLRKKTDWKQLYFYQKADTIFQLTYIFCRKFLPPHGDRTVDQMVQAARSGKQNIVEGSEDGMTSTEMEIRLLNAARGSLQELQRDYIDYLHTRQLPIWDETNERYRSLLNYCRRHNIYSDYEPFSQQMNDEEFANLCYSLCRITDRMMETYLKRLEKEFITEGGIKERMHRARTGYREKELQRLAFLENEVLRLQTILKNHGIDF